MLLQDKNAVIYGGGGAIGSAVARAFAREGANVFLAGRTLGTLDRVAEEISAAGGSAEAAEVDALDESAVADHADAVASRAGGIDVALNAVGILHVQGPRSPSCPSRTTPIRSRPTRARTSSRRRPSRGTWSSAAQASSSPSRRRDRE
jgi:NAD(P)-dependent dehydrogenase (short-subunit alcohol dehydrogenase family)